MASVFVRSLALAGVPDACCVVNASRTPADGTFAVSSRHEGVIQVYAASCAALLHEFATIHPRVHALHYTSFSDSLVTLESDRLAGQDEKDNGDEETFLCVYHDWRERDMVRGYTLPLGVLDTPTTKRKADCVAVCSYTGRVVVAMGSALNIWQCSQGFFEHVMEIKVDMTQVDAYHVVEYVAIHGIYVAFGSATEVRVMEVHVHSVAEVESTPVNSQIATSRTLRVPLARQEPVQHIEGPAIPEDDFSCVHFDAEGDSIDFDSIPIPLASYGDVMEEGDYLHLHEKSMVGENEETPVVLDRTEAQQEELNLAGLIKMQDIRVNQAMNYHIAEGDVRMILRRYIPPSQRIQRLKFLPETIDNHASLEARSYTRLVVCTIDHAFLYYFLSIGADVTRKRMVRKVLGKGDFKRQSSLSVRTSPKNASYQEGKDAFDVAVKEAESGRVVMHYAFSSPVTSITANSSFLFVTTSSSLQVWSIWSPCHHLAAARTSNSLVDHEPTQPQLISVEALGHAVCDSAALDAYVIVLPSERGVHAFEMRDLLRTASAAAAELLPASELEERGLASSYMEQISAPPSSMLIIQQSPPSAIFSLLQSKQDIRPQIRIDILLSLYSLYRYRADVGSNSLAEANEMLHSRSRIEAREAMAMDLENRLYDRLACDCAAALAAEFTRTEMRDFDRAALFFVESKVAPREVMQRFQELRESEPEYDSQIIQATHKYLEARVFQTRDMSTRGLHTKQSFGRLFGDALKDTFTQSAVDHYVKHAPEQLPRLLIDSNLVWTLPDLHFGFELLESVNVRDIALVNVAHLVLVLRAQSSSEDEWDFCRQRDPSLYDSMRSVCTYEALCESVDTVTQEDAKGLIHLCVSHPDLLVTKTPPQGRNTASPLSQALLARSPVTLVQILEAVFDSAISRRESIIGSVMLAVTAIGEDIRLSIDRIGSQNEVSTTVHTSTHTTGLGHCVLLRFVCFVLDAFPRLHALAEKDELSEDDEELLTIRHVLAMEMLHICVDAVLGGLADLIGDGQEDTLIAILSTTVPSKNSSGSGLPEWERMFLETWCIPKTITSLTPIKRGLLQRALSLLHEPKSLNAHDVLKAFETSPANDFGLLLVLLTLPQVNRTVDGLRLIAARESFVELFLPYGKCYCSTLEEWKFLIKTLSSLSDGRIEALGPSRSDELGVLESVLNHVCATLGPEDLLEVLPDDGDLAMFMATIEASVRLEDARAHTKKDSSIMASS